MGLIWESVIQGILSAIVGFPIRLRLCGRSPRVTFFPLVHWKELELVRQGYG